MSSPNDYTEVDINQINEIHWYESPEKKDNRIRTTFAKKAIRSISVSSPHIILESDDVIFELKNERQV